MVSLLKETFFFIYLVISFTYCLVGFSISLLVHVILGTYLESRTLGFFLWDSSFLALL